LLRGVALAALLGVTAQAAHAQIAIGHLVDYSGPTADVGSYGQGADDAFSWVNAKGGVNGQALNVTTAARR